MKKIKVGCGCETVMEVEVVPYYGEQPRGYKPVNIFCDKCGEARHPVTKKGVACPSNIYTVVQKINRGENNEIYFGVEIFTTSEGRRSVGPSVINTEDADSIISMFESGKEGRDYFLTFEEAEAAAKAAQATH